MAKVKQSIDLTGVSINKILDMSPAEVSGLNKRDLAKVVSRLASAANKRLKRLEQTGIGEKSRAYKQAMKIGKFSVKGKNQGQLQNEFKRVRQFLRSESSTVKGWKNIRQRVMDRLGEPFEDDESENAFWTAYNQLLQTDRALVHIYGSEETQRLLREELKNESQLSELEKTRYRGVFPNDTRDLTNLSQVDLAVIRTLTDMAIWYEEEEGDTYADRGYSSKWSGFFHGWGGDDEEDE